MPSDPKPMMDLTKALAQWNQDFLKFVKTLETDLFWNLETEKGYVLTDNRSINGESVLEIARRNTLRCLYSVAKRDKLNLVGKSLGANHPTGQTFEAVALAPNDSGQTYIFLFKKEKPEVGVIIERDSFGAVFSPLDKGPAGQIQFESLCKSGVPDLAFNEEKILQETGQIWLDILTGQKMKGLYHELGLVSIENGKEWLAETVQEAMREKMEILSDQGLISFDNWRWQDIPRFTSKLAIHLRKRGWERAEEFAKAVEEFEIEYPEIQKQVLSALLENGLRRENKERGNFQATAKYFPDKPEIIIHECLARLAEDMEVDWLDWGTYITTPWLTEEGVRETKRRGIKPLGNQKEGRTL